MYLHVSDLSFSYGEKTILNNLNFQVYKGEFVSILGPSGCGKSTLLNILAGLLKPEEGEICLEGKRISGVSGKFAYMPQDDLLFPWKTILENVCLYGNIHHKKAEAMEQAKKQFPVFGLEGCEGKYPRELSGGMRQRAAFLRTSLCEAEILLLDEPFGALDVITRNSMQDWLLDLRKDLDRTILLVTHDTDEAIYLSDRILILGQGKEGIRKEVCLPKKEQRRDRDWLYGQSELRREIHHGLA